MVSVVAMDITAGITVNDIRADFAGIANRAGHFGEHVPTPAEYVIEQRDWARQGGVAPARAERYAARVRRALGVQS